MEKDANATWDKLFNPKYEPLLVLNPTQAQLTTCGTNQFCLFDAVAVGAVFASKTTSDENTNTQEQAALGKAKLKILYYPKSKFMSLESMVFLN